MSVNHVELTADEAIKELKAVKVSEQKVIALLQSDRSSSPPSLESMREQSIANHRRRIDALHMAIAALER